MWFWDGVILVFGLCALIKGADLLVQKSALLCRRFSLSPFFVGVVLLGMGTSAPEAGVSALSSLKGLSHLAVGNVFGSNIFNILLVLGLILFQPLPLKKITGRKKDIWFLVLTGFVLGPLMWDLFLSRLEAFLLSLLFFGYMLICYFNSGREAKDLLTGGGPATARLPVGSFGLAGLSFWMGLGFLLLAGGAHLTVMGAEGLGRRWGISERILGLLVVSAGTSLPEFVASLTALIKGHKDMAIGNIIGSNVFNTFAILSLAVWIRPAPLDMKMLVLDLPALWITHLLLLVLIFGYHLKWVQKVLPYVFFMAYGAFLLSLFLYPEAG